MSKYTGKFVMPSDGRKTMVGIILPEIKVGEKTFKDVYVNNDLLDSLIRNNGSLVNIQIKRDKSGFMAFLTFLILGASYLKAGSVVMFFIYSLVALAVWFWMLAGTMKNLKTFGNAADMKNEQYWFGVSKRWFGLAVENIKSKIDAQGNVASTAAK